MALSLATAPMGMATAGPIKLGVNGFGRIGRQVVRIAMDRDAFELKHINGARAPEYLKYLLVSRPAWSEISFDDHGFASHSAPRLGTHG